MQDNKNLFLAIALSVVVLLGWNFFVGMPQMQKQREQAAQQAQQAQQRQQGAGQPAQGGSASPAAPGQTAASRDSALGQAPRVTIENDKVSGSFSLRGGDIDDIALKDYHETVDPSSPRIVVFSPATAPDGYYAWLGWRGADGKAVDVPSLQTLWTADRQKLTPTEPVTLSWDNGKGLVFKRKLTIDDGYFITATDSVENKSDAPVELTPYGFIRRIGTPHVQGYYILHEGLIGVVGGSLQEFKYSDIVKKDPLSPSTPTDRGVMLDSPSGGWVGITDKYWASALVPDQKIPFKTTFEAATPASGLNSYLTSVTLPQQTVAPGATVESTSRVFVGAKEVRTLEAYQVKYGIDRFNLLIDWGYFFFITQPMFKLLDTIYKFVGNFGVAILIVTLIVKAVFYPLANKSYTSMAKMKAVQPQMQALKEQFPDDKVKQQQALMELYKKEKINPVAGCLPVIIQIPVFFSLYKVLFVTIEMRHAPFFGWIRDLSAPDPTSVFNLFGLIPWTPPHVLMIGVWPLIMGVTMFVQMKMNPEPQDPVQKTMFTWMPVFFTYLLASFPAGLVIYWSWNNTLSVLQQYSIMKRQGVKVELWDNLRRMRNPAKSPAAAAPPAPAPAQSSATPGGKGNGKAGKPA